MLTLLQLLHLLEGPCPLTLLQAITWTGHSGQLLPRLQSTCSLGVKAAGPSGGADDAQVTLGPGAPKGPVGHFSQSALGWLLSVLSGHWEYGMKGQVNAFKPKSRTRPPTLVGKANVPEARLVFGPQDTAEPQPESTPIAVSLSPGPPGPRPRLLHLHLQGGESCSLQGPASSQCTGLLTPSHSRHPGSLQPVRTSPQPVTGG